MDEQLALDLGSSDQRSHKKQLLFRDFSKIWNISHARHHQEVLYLALSMRTCYSRSTPGSSCTAWSRCLYLLVLYTSLYRGLYLPVVRSIHWCLLLSVVTYMSTCISCRHHQEVWFLVQSMRMDFSGSWFPLPSWKQVPTLVRCQPRTTTPVSEATLMLRPPL